MFRFDLLHSSEYSNALAKSSFSFHHYTLWKRYFMYNSSLHKFDSDNGKYLIFDTSSLIDIKSSEVLWKILRSSKCRVVIPSGVLSELKKLATVKDHAGAFPIYEFISKASNSFIFIAPSGVQVSFQQAILFKYEMTDKLECMDDHIVAACTAFKEKHIFLVTSDRFMAEKALALGICIYSSQELASLVAQL